MSDKDLIQIRQIKRWARNEDLPKGPLTPHEFVCFFGALRPAVYKAANKVCVLCQDGLIRPR